ncbi:MAG: insulinase family protein, partial [Euryarchaeota archaeon]|nr:insulinase family protein [Euryarchaeota archaeon]
LLRPLPEAPAVSVWVGYKVGSRHERPGVTGATHWVEHMLFKGGGKLKKGDIDAIVGRLGGKFNGFTDADLTAYFETLPPDHLDTGLMIEAERMRNAAFDPPETEAERGVIISEREGGENNPKILLSEELWQVAFHIHPYHWPVIGWKTDLERMTREELYTYYLEHYAPNNAVLVLTGRFSEREAMENVNAYFGDFRPEKQTKPPEAQEPRQEGERRSVVRRPGTQDHLLIGYRVPELRHEDTAPLLVLQSILGGWKGFSPFGSQFVYRSNRLYRGLVDKKLATEVSAQHAMRADPGLFLIEATVREGVDPAKVEKATYTEIETLRDKPPAKEEMVRALRQMRAWTGYDLDGPTAQGLMLTWFEVIAGHRILDELLARCQSVTPKDVQRVARTYFPEDNRSVCTFLARRES